MPFSSSVIRVRYAETDKMGVAYYANYFVWFEVGRCDLLRSLGRTYRDLESEGVMLPVIEAHCEFFESARYDDELNIETCGSLLSQARIEFSYEIVRSPDRIQLATGRTVHASVNLSGRPLRLPVDLQGALT